MVRRDGLGMRVGRGVQVCVDGQPVEHLEAGS